jgi:hypothetical protein
LSKTASREYNSLKILKSLVLEQVESEYNHGPFKLICDDQGLANLIVRSRDDLTIVGLVELE